VGRRGHYEIPDTASDDSGQRECSRGDWCIDPRLIPADGGGFTRQPALTPRAFCERDQSAIRRSLGEMPGQYLHLKHELARTGGGRAAVRIPFGPRVPLRVDIDALMSLITESLTGWHQEVAAAVMLGFPDEAAPDLPEDMILAGPVIPWSRLRRDMAAVREAARILGAHLTTLTSLQAVAVTRQVDLRDLADWPEDTDGIVTGSFASLHLDFDGADAGLEILHLHYLARAVLGETKARPEELDGIACRAGTCERRALVRAEPPSSEHDPGYWSHCLACGDKMTEGEYRDWVALCAAYERSSRRIPGTLDELPPIDTLIATVGSAGDLQ
jgi:hypothetical protein